jgi:SAM-dependent methyltransferase
MSTSTPAGTASEEHPAHRAFVGPPEKFDLASAGMFNLLTALGLRQHHSFLDIGCGSLRGGRLFIPYLEKGNYFGIEPEQWLIDQGVETEIGKDLARLKQPSFSNDTNFTLTTFGRKFDYMLAQSIFSHATQAQIRRCLAQAKLSLEPAGIFAATFFIGEKNYEGTQWVYPGRVCYTAEYFNGMADAEGLQCRLLNWTHTNQQQWVAITHRENTEALPDIADTARTGVLEHEIAALKDRLDVLQKLRGLKILKQVNGLFKGSV